MTGARGWHILGSDHTALRPAPGDVARARDTLLAARVEHPEVVACRDRAVAMVDASADPLDRDQLPDHLTASAVVIDTERGALLLEHRKLRRWFQPGGHVDGDGNLVATALREATEETGIRGLRPVIPAVDVDVHDVAYPDGSFHVHHDIRFLVLVPTGATVNRNRESTGARWVTGDDDLAALDTDASTRRLVRRGLAVAASLIR